ncbi:hypothetical protein J4H86_20605 [Spiractinospora alimapuensis]|uniref:hypothetical protein n=1 Tax=Spiractinospora alimapuensis TaxID=2820884 RepID=UPI001F1A150E|nr:hypothetical protein [Spiractinospora alimapuensis]QVQ51202.1 hypothetical protein J4H86_20605 [Spiractinospora alimapuensis]
MIPSATRRLSLPLTILLLAAAGCSGDGSDDSQESADGADPQNVQTVEDLGALCESPGEGYPEAAEYTEGGPNPTAIFSAASRADTDPLTEPSLVAPGEDVAEDATPIVGWHPDSVEETSLLVCAETKDVGEELHTCEYQGSGGAEDSALPLRSQVISFTVYELATGEALHESDFTATNGHHFGSGLTTDCPTFLQYETFPTELYGLPSAEDIYAELGTVVEGAAG